MAVLNEPPVAETQRVWSCPKCGARWLNSAAECALCRPTDPPPLAFGVLLAVCLASLALLAYVIWDVGVFSR